ncbi:hypothetical protein TNCV_1280711 [Trichonephila clavipes]|nr:hypothetical protein TNCV_1280711 [Trichonephila clavipes]
MPLHVILYLPFKFVHDIREHPVEVCDADCCALSSSKSSSEVGGRGTGPPPNHPQGVLPQNWGGTEQNRAVTFMVLKATDNDRCKNLVPCHDEFREH